MVAMETTSYRLERWIAFFLSLLFFLPFVANADEILVTDSFHGDEIKVETGAEFLSLTCGADAPCVLRPVKIRVTRQRDIYDDEGEATGKRVDVLTGEEGYLLRSRRLQPGVVEAATPADIELTLDSDVTFTLRGASYRLRYRCGTEPDAEQFVECALLLESNGVVQQIGSLPVLVEKEGLNTLEVQQFVAFAGDLDRDGRLDLIANTARHWNEWRATLLLSTAAKEGQLVASVAELASVGC